MAFNNVMAGNFGSTNIPGESAWSQIRNPAIESATGLYNATPNFNNTNQAAKSGIENRTYDSGNGTFYQSNKRDVGGIDPLTGRRIEISTGTGGTWSTAPDGMGRQINDLPGFLQKGSLQRTGSDFSDYENQLRGLMSDPSKIQQTAGYQFDVDQGNQAINRSAAARGQLGGGGVLAELAKYGQGMASKEYGNQVNRLSSLIGQKQQFGIGSGYYDDLKTPQITSGGGGGSRAAPAPQKDPYQAMADRENAQMAQFNQDIAQWESDSAAADKVKAQEYKAMYGRDRPY